LICPDGKHYGLRPAFQNVTWITVMPKYCLLTDASPSLLGNDRLCGGRSRGGSDSDAHGAASESVSMLAGMMLV
jgi:hypothetical protein